jgi:hypothetical protein
MLQLVADENFNNNIVRGILRQKADVDIVRIQDVGLSRLMTQQFWNGRVNKAGCY